MPTVVITSTVLQREGGRDVLTGAFLTTLYYLYLYLQRFERAHYHRLEGPTSDNAVLSFAYGVGWGSFYNSPSLTLSMRSMAGGSGEEKKKKKKGA